MHARKNMGITCITTGNLRDKKGFPQQMLDVEHAFKARGGGVWAPEAKGYEMLQDACWASQLEKFVQRN